MSAVTLSIQNADEKRIKQAIKRCKDDAWIIDHNLTLHEKRSSQFDLQLGAPKSDAIAHFAKVLNVQIVSFGVDVQFQVEPGVRDEVLTLLQQHLACPAVSVAPSVLDKKGWMLNDERFQVNLGACPNKDNAVQMHVTALEPTMAKSALRNPATFLRADLVAWVSRKVMLIDPQRKEIGKLLRQRKGLGVANDSTYIRAFNRTIGTRGYSKGQELLTALCRHCQFYAVFGHLYSPL